MKPIWTALACFLAIYGIATFAHGQETDNSGDRPLLAGPEGRGQGGQRARGFAGRQTGRPGGQIIAALRNMDLADEQKQQVREVLASHGQAMRQFREQHGEQASALRHRMREAMQARNREQIEAVRNERRELRERAPTFDALLEDLDGILTAEQIAQLEAARPERPERRARGGNMRADGTGEAQGPRAEMRGRIHRALSRLNLTEDQRTEIRRIAEGHRAEVRAFREAHREARAGYRERLAAAREAGDRDEIRAIHAEMREQLGENRPDLRGIIDEVKAVLTPEQIEQLENMRQRRGGGRGGNAGGEE